MQITFDENTTENVDIDDNKSQFRSTNVLPKISPYEHEYKTKNDIFYTDKELKKIQEFVELAKDKRKYKWKSIESDIDTFEMEYVESQNSSSGICIARGTIVIDCNPEDIFFGYDDYTKIKDLDENCLSVELKHKYDDHRRIMSGSFHAPLPFWNREILFEEMRCIIDEKGNIIHNVQMIDLQNKLKRKGRSSVCLGFSVKSDECPFEDVVRKKHVRCDLKFGGYYFTNIGDNKCRATYLVCMDIGGWVPSWFTNVILPQQSKNILKMKDYVDSLILEQ